ncbi:MAG: DUF6516 family protein [Anaerolineales bacterium]|nr:DUF6516 family protein [Anaerolineales bacterium]
MSLLDDLIARMSSIQELSDIQVLENELADDETFAFKVRATIAPNFLQIRLLADRDFKRYSFQLYGDCPLLRWDNAPHYPDFSNFPHHFHSRDNNAYSSALTGNLLDDFDIVMAEIKQFMNL